MKRILTSSITPMYSQEQAESTNWQSFAEQQQQEGEANPTDQQQQQQQQQQNQDEDDPFKGLNLENADDATKQAIEKIRLSYTNTTKAKTEAEEKLGRVTSVAQQYQSKADKAEALLKKHNLSTDSHSNTPQPTLQEQQEAAVAAELMKEGMKEDAAKAHAKIFLKAMGVVRPSILQEVGSVLGPAVGQLSSLQADKILSTMDTQVAFKIPGVQDAARAIVNTMIQTNQVINENTVNAAVQLAIGEVMMKEGGDVSALTNLLKGGNGNTQQRQQQQQPSILQQLFGGNLTTSGNFPATGVRGNGTGAPIAANEETAKLAAAIAAQWDRDVKKS